MSMLIDELSRSAVSGRGPYHSGGFDDSRYWSGRQWSGHSWRLYRASESRLAHTHCIERAPICCLKLLKKLGLRSFHLVCLRSRCIYVENALDVHCLLIACVEESYVVESLALLEGSLVKFAFVGRGHCRLHERK